MGIIKKHREQLEYVKNQYKILEGKFNQLRIKVDLVNSKPKQLPDSNTYKPQQPYLFHGLKLRLVRDEKKFYKKGGDSTTEYGYIASDRMKFYTYQDRLIGHYRRYEIEQLNSLFKKYNLLNVKTFGVYGKFMKIADIQSINPEKTKKNY